MRRIKRRSDEKKWMRRSALAAAGLTMLFCLLAPVFASAADAEVQPAPVVVLDTSGYWRMHHTLQPPVIALDDGLKPILMKHAWLRWETEPPVSDWVQPEFDDGDWLRAPALRCARTPYLARACVRGRFRVSDPEAVRGLKLTVGYHGGVIVYVNGREVGRKDIAPEAGALADGYPREADVAEDGTFLDAHRRGSFSEEDRRRIALRDRVLELDIPSDALVDGVNVLAVELVRAPYHKAMEELKGSHPDDRMPGPYYVSWNTCELNALRLTAESAEGLAPNATRPEGLQVWTRDVNQADFDVDFGDPCEPIRPVRIVGAANGAFSGKIVVGSSEPIRNLEVTVSDLTGADTIPADAVRVRYGLPWGRVNVTYPYGGEPSPYAVPAQLLGMLSDEPPAEYGVVDREPDRYSLSRPGQPSYVGAAVAPVWITVQVPEDAQPGQYVGEVTVAAEGHDPLTVPLELDLAGWTLPDPGEYRTWVELLEAPDTLAVEYGLDLWSDRHFRMIGRAMDYLHDVGSRVLYIPLIAETNLGNAESIVRWVDNGDGTYDCDFSVMDRYLDLAVERMGRPRLVCFNVWDVYVGAQDKVGNSESSGEQRALAYLQEKGAPLGDGPIVTFVDPKTGETENRELPGYMDEPSKGLWQPLVDRLKEKMEERGLGEAMALGIATDSTPRNEEVEFWNDLTGDLPWVGHSHHGFFGNDYYRLGRSGRIVYQSRVWHVAFADGGPEPQSRHGWSNPGLISTYQRSRNLVDFPLAHWRHMGEYNVTSDQRGIGRVGADFWPVIKDKRGRRAGSVSARYPQSSWRNLDLYSYVLAPGPTGPCPTARYVVLREGVQECEARIVIERALMDEEMRAKLGDDLAERCQRLLDERLLAMWTSISSLRLHGASWDWATAWRSRPGPAGQAWFVGSDWQRRTRELYSLAGEVERALQQ